MDAGGCIVSAVINSVGIAVVVGYGVPIPYSAVTVGACVIACVTPARRRRQGRTHVDTRPHMNGRMTVTMVHGRHAPPNRAGLTVGRRHPHPIACRRVHRMRGPDVYPV